MTIKISIVLQFDIDVSGDGNFFEVASLRSIKQLHAKRDENAMAGRRPEQT